MATTRTCLPGRLVGDEREGDAGEVGAAAVAADDDVGVVARELELLLRLEADHRLVQADVVQHAAERVAGVLVRGRVLDRLGDGDAERALAVRDPREDAAAGVVRVEGDGEHLRAPELHHRLAVGLLLERDLHHVDGALEPEHLAASAIERAPLPRAGLGRDPLRARRACCSRPAAPPCSACASPAGETPSYL